MQLCYKPLSSQNFPGKRIRLNRTDPASPSPLLPAFEHQDKAFSAAFDTLRNAVTQQAFPAASIAVTHQGRLIALKTFGRSVYSTDMDRTEGGEFDVTPSTLFDIASLTKVVATTTVAMLLYQRGLLDLDAPIAAIIPEFLASPPEKDLRRSDVTLRMLLAHSSGLPAYEKLFLKAHTRDDLLHAAFAVPLTADPGSRAEYSDIGFIILGVALECLAGESLDQFSQREIFGPLAMTNTTFNPAPELRPQIPPTADERKDKCGAGAPAREMPKPTKPPSGSQPAVSSFRNRIIQGEVQDENAFVLGGVAGHAGLFSTAEDIAKFAHAMLNARNPILRHETVTLFTRREPAPPGTSRALGWDTPSTPSQSGKHFSANSFGHLGYTGTSLWIDPTRQLSVTLLTNRTWPDCSNQAIKQVRPQFHDAVIEALDKMI